MSLTIFFFVIKLFWGIDLWVWLLTLIYQFVTKYSTDALKSLHLWRKCTNLNNVATSWVILFAIQNLLSFLFFHMYLYFFSHSSKTIYVVLVKCMELSLCNGCHSLSSCLTSDLLLSFLQYSNNLFIYQWDQKFVWVRSISWARGLSSLFRVLFFSLTFRKDQMYMCVNTTQGVCVQSAVQCNRYICSRKNRFHLTLLIQSTYPEEGHLTH